MAIGTAVQKGNMVYWYDERGRQLGSKLADGLQGYTASSVSIRKGNMIYVFDEKGRQTASMLAR